MERSEIGKIGEDVACAYLKRKGYRILMRNYREKWGEVDIIAEKENIVRFVEVKSVSCVTLPDVTRENDRRPEELVHQEKLRKISRVAEYFMAKQRDNRCCQIDVVAVFLDHGQRKARCRLLEQVL